jgi:hypothetical protein
MNEIFIRFLFTFCDFRLTMSFQPDKNSEISKTQLYAHYQHIAKIKGWTVLTIPTFFEILK